MTLTYQQSFSASLDDNGAQKAMPLPALTKGITYNFNVGFDSGWRTYWDNPSGFYVTYETVLYFRLQIKSLTPLV